MSQWAPGTKSTTLGNVLIYVNPLNRIFLSGIWVTNATAHSAQVMGFLVSRPTSYVWLDSEVFSHTAYATHLCITCDGITCRFNPDVSIPPSKI